ncbi:MULTISPECIES: hypothetical protein [unclassified Flavobacterium]|uniref:hypothetical protein n=1 Tax=unclassified Flavobacterium TaxID=196869 RepID=UPI000F0C672E|nr:MULTISPECIES: hypothetical protein [unclassified Flavobacterium]AYN02874.1 hypothetical protein EAG11_00820 [Flavobacterium sp. 140616W15]MCD0473094.1 hypothetical protein [Flavobacterium sp. EDS]
MKKLLYLLVFCPFLGFSQNDPNYAVDCDANDIMKEIYQEGNNTIIKCTDKDGNFVLNVIPNNQGGGGSGGNGSDTGLSQDPGKEEGPGRTCINTWVRGEKNWVLVSYCG